ncbi:MAG: DUF4214 domain-containing protein [Actinobacteria bacterium]|nr:DUF4214 domain-containing protein [Actinomycetota bacterium]MBM3713050.1 DUF4214 domain-containing protein [Actinomycetota bacterium]
MITGVNFSSLFADTRTNVTEFVIRFYNYCLNREPDQEGLNNWVERLLAKKITGAQTAESFIFSPEFTAKQTDNKEFLNILYRAFFNREPDPAGFNNWLSLLNSGYSRHFILAGFINSDEFIRLCNSYGIKAGKIDPGAALPVVQVSLTTFPIIALHGVEPVPSGRYEISNGAFDFLLGTLKSYGYQTITLNDILNYLDKGKALPPKPVIITSDDGYQNMYTNAFPILKKYGYKMTIFLITSIIGDKEQTRKMNEFDWNISNIPHRPMLIWPEIKAMSKYGCEFQSHTWSHRIIRNIPIEDAKNELLQSKYDIETNTGKPCVFVSWPHDAFSDKVIALLPLTGYRGALRAGGGVIDIRNLNLYDIKRAPLTGEIPPEAYAGILKLQ